MKRHSTTRRGFLKTSLAAGLAPAVLPAGLLGANAPSRRINLAMIGVGRQGINVNLATLLNMPEVRIVALCDVDAWRAAEAKKRVDQHYGANECAVCADWREVVARDDVDAVMNSTPDHWHVPISLAAVERGKHVSCEKPLTLCVTEGRRLADAVEAHGVVFRTDTECRSNAYMHKITELVRNGYIGNVTHIDVGVPLRDRSGGNPAPMPVPEELDYNMWLGPAPMAPYTVDRVHPRKSLGRPEWMRCSGTCEGVVTNWGTHMLDVAQLVLDTQRTGPVEVEGTGTFCDPAKGLWDVVSTFDVRFRYADGVTLRYHTDDKGAYIKVTGDEGWIHGDWHRKGPGFIASDPKILKTKLRPADTPFPQRSDKGDFTNAILTGEPTMIDAEIGHRTCSMGQIAHIALQCGKKLAWDPAKERFTNDDAANELLTRPVRNWQEA